MRRVGAAPLVDTGQTRSGIPGIVIESDLLRVTVIPEVGAKVLEIVHLASGFDLLWQNERVPLRRTYPGAPFDDLWCGGWDELFPTDPPCEIDGNTFHDHGDLWHGPWDCRIVADDGERATLHLRRFAVSLPCLMEKWISLERGSLHIRFRHRLTNLGSQPVAFAWNLHVAHRISPDSRIYVPAGRVAAVAEQPGRFASARDGFDWPRPGSKIVGAVAPPESGITEWLYTREPEEGWCAVGHPSAGIGLGLAFDHHVFRTTWLWGVYGGWRGHYVLLTEPSTSPPGGLAHNVATGTAATLGSGAVLETAVVASVFEDVDLNAPADRRPASLPSLSR
jgi:hypothetical protein